jgi:predicted phosphodiesterase
MLMFRDLWKPSYVACLGDFTDMTAFMGNASGASLNEPIAPDIDDGLMHLKMMRPTDVLMGNHEDRIYRLRSDRNPNAIVQYAAHKCVEQIEETCRKIKARTHEYTGVHQLVRVENSDIALTHGTIYNQNSCRDMANIYCNGITVRKILFGHTHKAGMASAKTYEQGTGYNIGCLVPRASLEYAKTRPETLSWTMGWSYFEYCNELGISSVNLITKQKNEQWRLPI